MLLSEIKTKPEVRKLFYQVDLNLIIAMAITDLRISNGLTQAKLAKKIGIKESTIEKIEAAEALPSIKTLEKISKAFDKTLILRYEDI